ncbi:hypothetical protein FDP41_003322 [Naegleria fowleri]|uniref:Uncharacterized protein n=1 Tax=Naegleria fowleri TaxID=5763 RepID=A0A6A5BU91_NAEFO|nr:uncharacterized protein FDP41_003322 [Naegleria fowleri]KAF0977330.1 hypothetical protein FDP41_003322 [Naegleria fowleri]
MNAATTFRALVLKRLDIAASEKKYSKKIDVLLACAPVKQFQAGLKNTVFPSAEEISSKSWPQLVESFPFVQQVASVLEKRNVLVEFVKGLVRGQHPDEEGFAKEFLDKSPDIQTCHDLLRSNKLEEELKNIMFKAILNDTPVKMFLDDLFSEFKEEIIKENLSSASVIEAGLKKKGMQTTPLVISLALSVGADGLKRLYEKSKHFKFWQTMLDENSHLNQCCAISRFRSEADNIEVAQTLLQATREAVAEEYNELVSKRYQSTLLKKEAQPIPSSTKKKSMTKTPTPQSSNNKIVTTIASSSNNVVTATSPSSQQSSKNKVVTTSASSSNNLETNTSPSSQLPSNVEALAVSQENMADEKMSVDQIYNALINNDHKAMASFYFSLSDLPQQIRGLNETLTKMDARITSLDARITSLDMRMTNFEKRMEKEMKEIRQVKLQFQKDDEFITHNPVVLKESENQAAFAIARANQVYSSYLMTLHLNNKISDENARKLNLETKEIEINFIKKHKVTGAVEIFEATISTFSSDEKLLTKMIQLERQIMFYKECFKNTIISRVGLVSPSNLTLQRVKQVIETHNGLFINIQSFVNNNTFDIIREGHKPEID